MFCAYRITSIELDCFLKLKKLEEPLWKSHLFVKEIGKETEKPHIQGFVVFDYIEEAKARNKFLDARRANVRRIFKVKGNEGLSIKVITDEDHIENMRHYLTKDQNIISSDVPTETLEEWFFQYIKKKDIREKKKELKKKGYDYSTILDECYKEHMIEIQQYEHYKFQKPAILVEEFLLGFLGKKVKAHTEIDAAKWFWQLMARYHPTEYRRSFKKKLRERIGCDELFM